MQLGQSTGSASSAAGAARHAAAQTPRNGAAANTRRELAQKPRRFALFRPENPLHPVL